VVRDPRLAPWRPPLRPRWHRRDCLLGSYTLHRLAAARSRSCPARLRCIVVGAADRLLKPGGYLRCHSRRIAASQRARAGSSYLLVVPC
jgi:hypothetical protein